MGDLGGGKEERKATFVLLNSPNEGRIKKTRKFPHKNRKTTLSIYIDIRSVLVTKCVFVWCFLAVSNIFNLVSNRTGADFKDTQLPFLETCYFPDRLRN